jgi:hypothetical protein
MYYVLLIPSAPLCYYAIIVVLVEVVVSMLLLFALRNHSELVVRKARDSNVNEHLS